MNDLDAVPSHAQRDDPRAAVDQRLQLARAWQGLDEVVAADQTARGLVPVCVLPRVAADGVGAERAALVLGRVLAVGGISADDVARLSVAHEVDALLMDEQHGGSLDRLGGIRHVALPRRGDRMLDDPADVLGLETENGHQRLFSISAFGPGFFLWRRAVRLITLTEARSAADGRVANAPRMTFPLVQSAELLADLGYQSKHQSVLRIWTRET